jgi:hypothetical protein
MARIEKLTIKKTKSQIEDMSKEPRFMMSYGLDEKSGRYDENRKEITSPRWIRHPYMTSQEVKDAISQLILGDEEFRNLEIFNEITLDIPVDLSEERNAHIKSYDNNIDVFGNIVEGSSTIPLVERTSKTEEGTLRHYKFSGRYTWHPQLPFFQKYNAFSDIHNTPRLVLVDDEGKDITDEVVKVKRA